MHKPAINPEVVRRVTERRGGLRVFHSINCERTAHIVVDLQNGFMAPGAVAEIGTAREIVPNVNRVSDAVRKAGVDKIHFAWLGGSDRGQPHYYRIQGPTFLVEYDNTQNNANHIHSVWRDFNGDFGADLLSAHYNQFHSAKGTRSAD